MSRGFTGRHMWLAMVGFFGLVIAVNFTMAWFASSTFGGTVVDNSYVASQQYNGWLRAARVQAGLGWQTQLAVDADRHVTLAVSGDGGANVGAAGGYGATGTAHHPLGRAPDIVLAFAPAGDGKLRSLVSLPTGRWLVRVTVRRDGRTLRLASPLQ